MSDSVSSSYASCQIQSVHPTLHERDVAYRMNEGYRAWREMKSVLSNRELRIKAKKCVYEGAILPKAL